MNINKFKEDFKKFAEKCGVKDQDNDRKNAIWRDSLRDAGATEKEWKKGGYFGYIHPEQPTSGPYKDFSLVVFPQYAAKDEEVKTCVIALGVGSSGFELDQELSLRPGTRRLFSRIRTGEKRTFFKLDFSDTTSTSTDLLTALDENDDFKELTGQIKTYEKVLPACQIVDFRQNEEQAFKSIKKWIATYAEFRGWLTKDKKKKFTNDGYLPKAATEVLSVDEIYNILKKERFIVLQGAPGTGKTYMANKIEDHFKKEDRFFEQFHAETTYADFVWGIRPKLNSETLVYESHPGVLGKAIQRALELKDSECVLLIIDEINRANLSNVLGPVFYLFEKNAPNRDGTTITIGDPEDPKKVDQYQANGLVLTKLPEKLYVIATMNTADRSLAVVDFALRRRFTWITLKPHELKPDEIKVTGLTFYAEEFRKFAEIFEKYATDEELNLQPGQSYFFADSEDAMNDRLKYELMPLIKEYINEGYLKSALNEFSNYFYEKLGIPMFE